MSNRFSNNWTTKNNGYELNSSEVNRYISVTPSQNQLEHSKKPFYCFIHFGMNTSTGREWGVGNETVDDFKILTIDAKQWVSSIKSSGATGIILTCKHHDGFCLWHTKYTDFSIDNTAFKDDIVHLVSQECRNQGLDFGIYLSPWDMHDERYGTEAYNDYFCHQLEELLTNYGRIFEVWFDGAKGSNAVKFEYDWDRYYDVVRKFQPDANIAICGSDIRWVGNEAGKTRKSEFSVVPSALANVEKVMKNSQHQDGKSIKNYSSSDNDLGSRKVLLKNAMLSWYPAEVDVSIRKGWFYSKDENKTVKSAKKLFNIYLNSVGNNCYLLLNVPPNDQGVIHKKDVKSLKGLGKRIKAIEEKTVLIDSPGELSLDNDLLDYSFGGLKKLKYIVLGEDIRFSQRVEAFDLYLQKPNGKYKKVCSSTIIGMKRILKIKKTSCIGARLVIRQSRSNPVLSKIAFYE